MIYFRTKETRYPLLKENELEDLLNQKTAKAYNFFDFENTLGYVLSKERPLVGKKLKSGEVITSRYRHKIFALVPRVVTKWKVETRDNDTVFVSQYRLSYLSTLGFLIFFLGSTIPVISATIEQRMPSEGDQEELYTSLTLLFLFFDVDLL